MQLLDSRPLKAITKLLDTKMNGAPLCRTTGHSISSPIPDPTTNRSGDPTYNSTSLTLPNPTPNPPPHRQQKRRSNPWRADRLRDIFPPGLESNSRTNGSPYTFTPQHLYDILTYNRASRHAERTVINSAWYGKQSKAAKHEFIVIHIEDQAIPGLKNCIAIERNQGKPSKIAWAFSSQVASDTFRVSYDGNVTRLLEECQLSPYLVLERVSFHPKEALLLHNLVILIHHISKQHRRYHPVDTNCYWFTGLVWECMRRMCPAADYEAIIPGRRGRISYLHFIPNPIQVRNVLSEVANEINVFNLELPNRNNSAIAYEEDIATMANPAADRTDVTVQHT